MYLDLIFDVAGYYVGDIFFDFCECICYQVFYVFLNFIDFDLLLRANNNADNSDLTGDGEDEDGSTKKGKERERREREKEVREKGGREYFLL